MKKTSQISKTKKRGEIGCSRVESVTLGVIRRSIAMPQNCQQLFKTGKNYFPK